MALDNAYAQARRNRDLVTGTLEQLESGVILSELINSRKVMDYFAKTINYISVNKRRRGGIEYENRGIEDTFRDIPSLL